MRYKYLALLIIIVSIAIGVSIYQPPAKTAQKAPETVSQPISKAPTAQELLTLVNTERAKVGAKPLVMDERLNQSAQKKADEMSSTNVFDHVNSQGIHGYQYIAEYAPNLCGYYSENIIGAMTTHTSQQSVTSWMNSPAHREAILNARYDLTGIAVSGDYAVQHFCDIP